MVADGRKLFLFTWLYRMSQVRTGTRDNQDLTESIFRALVKVSGWSTPGLPSQTLGALRLDSNARLWIIVAEATQLAAYLRAESHGSVLEGLR